MQLLYGSFAHALSEAAVVVQKQPAETGYGYQYAEKEAWTITGFLQAPTQDLLVLASGALETAYSRNQQTLKLLAQDGTVARFMSGTSPLGGNRVIHFSFPDSGETTAEFTTFRRYQIQVEGIYPVPGGALGVTLSFMERLSFTGGGPRFVHLQPLTGRPVRQQVAEATPFRVTQRGQGVGLLAYPSPPPPIWPGAEQIDRRQIEYGSPRRTGGAVATLYQEWPVEWGYYFEDAGELDGAPNRWVGA